MKRLLLCLVMVCLSSSAFGLREYYSISKSVRALGMGGAFYGLSNDEYAMFYNPAGLAYYEGGAQGMLSVNTEISPSVLDAVSTLSEAAGKDVDEVVSSLEQFQGKVLHAGATAFPYYLRKHFAVGLLVADAKLNFAILGRELDTELEVTPVTDSGFFVSYGRSFFDPNLVLGMTIKGMFRLGGTRSYSVLDIAQGNADFSLDPKNFQDGGGGAGVDFDLGGMYTLPFTPFGTVNRVSMVINNVLASDFNLVRIQGAGAPPGLVRMLSVAAHSRIPGVGPIDHFDAVFDLAEFGIGGETNTNLGSRSGSFFKHINFGVEATMGWFFARTGFRQGYWTAGLGLDARFLKLDLATYQEELFGTPGLLGNRRYAMRLVFGISAPRPAVEPMTSSPEPKDEPEAKTEETPKPEEAEKKPEAEPKKESGEPKKVEPPAEETKAESREPSSVKRRKRLEVPKEGNDRFDVDRLVEEYPESYNPSN